MITWKRYGELIATDKAEYSVIINQRTETSFSCIVMHPVFFKVMNMVLNIYS